MAKREKNFYFFLGMICTLVVVSFGRATGGLSRKGRRMGHTMLTDSWESLKVWQFSLQYMGKSSLVLHHTVQELRTGNDFCQGQMI